MIVLFRRLEANGNIERGAGQVVFVLGQLCIILAIVLGRLARDAGADGVECGPCPVDFWQGVLAGLAGVMIGASVPLNLSVQRRWRKGGR